MTQIYTIANQKGGVGKTTTSVNLAASLATYGKRVLMVDMDPQGNATMGAGAEKNQLQHSVYDVITGQVPTEQAIARPEGIDFHLLPVHTVPITYVHSFLVLLVVGLSTRL